MQGAVPALQGTECHQRNAILVIFRCLRWSQSRSADIHAESLTPYGYCAVFSQVQVATKRVVLVASSEATKWKKRCSVYSWSVLVAIDLAGVLRTSPIRKRSVSSARRWLEAFRLSTNCELMEGCAWTT